MKLLLSLLGGLIEWVFSLLWLPVHVRNLIQARCVESQARARQAHASELAANTQAMVTLWQMGSDTKPLARHIAKLLHEVYGVRPSSITPGEVVPVERRSPNP